MDDLAIELVFEAEKYIPYLFKFLASVNPLNSSNFKLTATWWPYKRVYEMQMCIVTLYK